jgi:DNA polymerase bacteriophage-type
MTDIPVDFETYWDKDYRLDRMPTAEYVCDPRFEIIGVALRTPDGVDHWVHGDANHVRSELLRLVPDWSAVRVVAHNARFEAAILEWRLGIKPGAYLCTMVGSRPHILPYTRSVSLDAVGRYLGVGVKGDMATKTAGMHRSDFTPSQLDDYGKYAIYDEKISLGISEYLTKSLPVDEQEVIDLTIKKFVRPRLRLDRAALEARLTEIEVAKQALVGLLESRYGTTLAAVRSRPQFAALLARHGCEPPQKLNKKGVATYAFAKDDLKFQDLLTHHNEAVRDLVKAKMALSSTQEESRIRRLIRLHDVKDGWLPVPLVYYGTHPGRCSGDDEINLQNLPRFEIKKGVQKGQLRKCIVPPDGYKIVTADFSQIEARIAATLAGQVDMREDFRTGADIYSKFATRAYGRPINKKDHPIERFVGKTCVLGLQYGMGAPKFHWQLAKEGVILSPVVATRIVHLYRDTYHFIPLLWRTLEALALLQMMKKNAMFCPDGPLGCLIFAHERIILPNGMPICYPGLKKTGHGLQFDSRFAGVESGNKLWGGTMLENICQALARIVATRAELRLARRGLPAAHQVHDELIWVVPDMLVDKVKAAIALSMVEEVDFLPALPVAVEVKHGSTYGDAK